MNKKAIALVILAVICALSATGCILSQALPHEHEFGEWSIVTAPTCTTNGQRERICECQEKEVETIPAIAHTYTPSVTSPTCTTPGYTTYTCACGHSYMGDHVQANGHTEVEHDAKAPTCTEIGWGAYVTCSSCDYTTYSELPATGHVEVVDPAVPATCTTTGLTEGKHCAVCNTVTLAQQTVNKVAHTEVIDQAVPATCTTTGLTEGKHCAVCNTVTLAQQTVNKVAHTEVIDPAVPATCTTTGLTEGKHCSVCNTVLVAQTTVNALGHTLSEVKVENNVPATCTTDGSYDNVIYCTTCKVELARNTVTVDKLGHDYKAVVTAPTCTTAGLTTHTCSRCQDSYTSNPTEATGHTEVIDQAVPATCTTTGLTEGKHCSVCDTVIVAQQTVNKVAHTEVVDQAVPATCSAEGLTEGKHCSVCNTVLVAQQPVAKLAHTEYTIPALAPTCTEDGHTESKYCSVCETVIISAQTVPATGHTEVTDQAVPATCSTTGLTAGSHCSVCDAVIVAQQTVNKVAHTEAIDAAVPATCTTTGLTEGKHCSVCNTVLVAQTTVPTLDHTVALKTENHVPATCTTDGSYDNVAYCTVCETEFGRTTVVETALGHNMDSGVVTTPATCTTDGSITFTCQRTDCTHATTEVIPATGHDYKAVVTAPTCTTAGLTTHTCSRCQDSYTSNPTEATGHTYTTTVIAPTCIAQGYIIHGCACGESYIDTYVDALGHDEVLHRGTAPTCTEPGWTNYVTCNRCDYATTKVEIPATGHGYSMYEDEYHAPTCTSDGYCVYTCNYCGYRFETDFQPSLQSEHVYTIANVHPATCWHEGEISYRCILCDHWKFETIPTQHRYVKTSQATCEEGGAITYKCEYCGDQRVEQSPALGHMAYQPATSNDSIVFDSVKDAYYYYAFEKVGDVYISTNSGMYSSYSTANILAKDDVTLRINYGVSQSYFRIDISGLDGGHNLVSADGPEESEILIQLYAGDALSFEFRNNYGYQAFAWFSFECVEEVPLEGATATSCANPVVCDRCDKVLSSIAHTPGEVVQVVDPRCGSDGYTEYKCTACGNNYRDNITTTGHTLTLRSDTQPDCWNDGSKDYYCELCDAWVTEVIPATGHSYQEVARYDPDCEFEGGIDFRCEICGDYYWIITEEALGHDYKAVITAPTCEQQGYTEYYCEKCGRYGYDMDRNYVPALGHIPTGEPIRTISPNCWNYGYTLYECGREGCNMLCQSDIVPALGHILVEEEGSYQEATCWQPASRHYYCLACGYYYQVEEGAPLAHNYQLAEVVAPTCTEKGYTIYRCEICWDEHRIEYLPPVGHNIATETVPGTCETDGYQRIYCTVCQMDIAIHYTATAPGHDYDVTVIDPVECVQFATIVYTCKTCQHSYSEFDYSIYLGHDLTVERQDPTCTEAGWERGSCSRCDYEYIYTYDANGHSYSSYELDPTCELPGRTEYRCWECGYSYFEDNDIPALGGTCVWELYNTSAPTCTEKGYNEYYCPNCDGYKKDDFVDALGGEHDFSVHVGSTPVTCDLPGWEWYQCSKCSARTTIDTEEPLTGQPCEYDDGVYFAPTCESDGYMLYTCTICGSHFYDEFEDMFEHDEYTIPAKPATCTEDGYTESICCSICQECFQDKEIIPATGHRWGNLQVTSATCEEDGYITITCGNCHAVADSRYDQEAKDYLVDYPYFNLSATGHTEVADDAVPATCSTTGLTAGSHCSVCGTVLVAQTTVDALGHLEVPHEGKEVTCTEDGYAPYVTCGRDGCDYTTYREIKTTGHYSTESYEKIGCQQKQTSYCLYCGQISYESTWSDHGSRSGRYISATCEEGAYWLWTCSDCGEQEKEYEGTPLGGTCQYDEGVHVEPTCSQEGGTLYTCTVCWGTRLEDVIPRIAHVYGELRYQSGGGCEDGSYLVYECSVCNQEVKAITPPSDHSYQQVKVVEPTCTSYGYTIYFCTKCGETDYSDYKRALGHLPVGEDIVVPPMCYNYGYTLNHCGRCDQDYKDNYVYGSGHTPSGDGVVVPPSCTSVGYTRHTCKDCGTTFDTDYVYSLEHTYVEEVLSVATCTSAASTKRTCTVCGVIEVYSYGNPLGHDFISHPEKESTCTEQGHYAYQTCSRCDFTSYQAKPANGSIHVFFNSDNCIHCGEPMSDKIVASYDISATADDHVTCLVVDRGDGKCDLYIRGTGNMKQFGEYGNANIKAEIGECAIKCVYIENGVTNVSSYIFKDCDSITSVTIASTVKSIGYDAFASAKNLSILTFEENSQCETIGGWAFYICNIKSLTIPASVKTIGYSAFEQNMALTELIFESNSQLTSIASSAFSYSALKEITLPASLVEFHQSAFYTCEFDKISVEEGNQHYKVVDGILYTMDGQTLIFYSTEAGENIVIPEGVIRIEGKFHNSAISSVQLPSTVEVIGDNAFDGTSITSITLPEGLTTIGFRAFASTYITEIVIPSTVTEIGDVAFDYAWALNSVTILGNPIVGSNAFYGTAFYNDESNWENGMLYIGTCLVASKGTQRIVTVKDGTTSIAADAFTSGFDDNYTTTTIIIPDSVTVIGESDISSIPNLTDVYFTGTEEQWNNINIIGDYSLFKDPSVTIHFNYVIE